MRSFRPKRITDFEEIERLRSADPPPQGMSSPRSAESLFHEALELGGAAERARFLDDACGENAALRSEVESLLDAHQRAGAFMARASGSSRAPVTMVDAPPGPAAPRGESRAADDTLPAIAGFRIERRLGRGGIGSVYEAWDETLQRRVAIKVLHAAGGGEARHRMLDEARKLASLRDPAVVTVHGVLDRHEPPAMVMELVEGYPLDRAVEGLTFVQRARLLQEIARALAVAHGCGILHRDLKPANVLVGPSLKPVLLDFGLALRLHAGETAGPGFEGTPLYASPEQVRGDPLTEASDIFSFGSLMFRVLTGAPPFSGVGIGDVLAAIERAAPPFPRDVALEVPSDLQAVCLACLARDPAARPGARQVALELGRYLVGEPVRLRPALYSDILRRRISEYSNDVLGWEQQGMISAEERDRLQLVHRRILADEDHWIIDTRRLTRLQTVLYTSTWLVVIASGLLTWLLRDEVAPAVRWSFPVAATLALVVIGVRAAARREELAAAAFLAGAVLSVVPTTLALLAEWGVGSSPPKGVTQLLGERFTNFQVLAACALALALSVFAQWRLRMTGFAWTTCALGAATYLAALLPLDWLGRSMDVRAFWTLPLVGLSAVALAFERAGRVRWALPFHGTALIVLVIALDVVAWEGPTLRRLGWPVTESGFMGAERQQCLSLALNGLLFLALMFLTERSRSLDLGLVPRQPFVLCLGIVGLATALAAYRHMIRSPDPRFSPPLRRGGTGPSTSPGNAGSTDTTP